MQRAIPAVFMRGGTSKGLFFRASHLAPFPLSHRNEIISSAMGSPDPDARQIDGMGGGLSSLSKVVVLSTPGEAAHTIAKSGFGFEDGISWADDVPRSKGPAGWDVVYRFAQVGVTNTNVDWRSTCGNLVSAVAHYAIDEKLVRSRVLREIARLKPHPSSSFPVPIRILACDSGKIVRATVQVQIQPTSPSDETSEPQYFACTQGDAAIAGVSGTSAPIEIENPLEGNPLPTTRSVDMLSIEGEEIPCTVVDAGLPTIFIPPSAVFSSPDVAASSIHLTPSELDASSTLTNRMELLRVAASRLTPQLSHTLSPSAPKICIVWPSAGYTTTGGVKVNADQVDVVVRGVSVGNFHRTIPATMLSALAVAAATPGSIVHQAMGKSVSEDQVVIRAGHPAGVARATVGLDESQAPRSIVYERTARRLFQGQVLARV